MRQKEDIEKILAASLKVFGQYGYKKATVADIALELGMTKGNLYLYAKNKQELYQRTVSFALTRWQSMVKAEIDAESDVKKKFMVMCFKAVEYLSKDNDLRQILVRDPDIFPMFDQEDPYKEINQASRDLIKSILIQGMLENKFRSVDAERISDVVFSIYKMFIIRTYIKEEEAVIKQVFEDTVELVTRGLFLDEI